MQYVALIMACRHYPAALWRELTMHKGGLGSCQPRQARCQRTHIHVTMFTLEAQGVSVQPRGGAAGCFDR